MNATALPGSPPARLKLPRLSWNALKTAAPDALPLTTPPATARRNALVSALVVALHVGLIWSLQSGPAIRPPELVVPVQALAELIETPAHKAESAPPTPPLPPAKPVTPTTPAAPATPAMPSVPAKAAPQTPAPPKAQPQAIADPTPSPNAPAGSLAPNTPAAPTPAAAGPATPTGQSAPAAPPAPASVQLPSTNADYLQNPKPAYPPLSRRMGEQGKVIVRVLIGADGQPQKAELKQSSSFERLDQAALTTVMKWRYVPGKRGGVAEDMWFNVPINFVLE
jgi:protein TonB